MLAPGGTIYLRARRSVGPTESRVSRDQGRTWDLKTTNGVQVSDLEAVDGLVRIDEALRVARLDDAACDEAARGGRAHSQRRGNTIDEPVVEGANAQRGR